MTNYKKLLIFYASFVSAFWVGMLIGSGSMPHEYTSFVIIAFGFTIGFVGHRVYGDKS